MTVCICPEGAALLLQANEQVKMHKHIRATCAAGMKCGGCVSRVKRILEGHANVTQVTFVTAQAECADALRV